jgi:tRNA pseudouridine55 synthase
MPRRPEPPDAPRLDGILVVAKPAGPTSHDVVALARRLTGTRRIGHGGTLDPFASGVLPLFLGFATRLVEYHLGDEKEYRATICLGSSSTTDDLDGELSPVALPPGTAPMTEGRVREVLATFLGPQSQRPPAYSAIQIGGRRAYDIARAGEAPELAARQVELRRLDLVDWDGTDPERPVAIVEVTCSAGTYVRALARDLGAALGSGGYLGALVRTRSGPFRLDDATSLDTLRAAGASGPDAVAGLLRPPDLGLETVPAVALAAAEVDDAAKGRFVRPAGGFGAAGEGALLRLVGPDGILVGIGRRAGRHIAPEKMAIR